jgi:hypothetical protein
LSSAPLPRHEARGSAAACTRGAWAHAFYVGPPHRCARGLAARAWAGGAAGGQRTPPGQRAAPVDAGSADWLCAGVIAVGTAILATASAQPHPSASSTRIRRRHAGLAVAAVVGASLAACASADAPGDSGNLRGPVQRLTAAATSGRRVSFDSAVQLCAFDDEGDACFERQLDGQGLSPASAAIRAQSLQLKHCLDPQLDGQWLRPASAATVVGTANA